MNVVRFGLAAALLAAGSAHAQLRYPASRVRPQAQPSPEARAFAKMPAPFERSYMVDEGAHPFTKLFDGYRTDPRLVAGINLNRYLALEAGYMERKDRGFHAIDPRDPLDTTGALGTRGFNSYAAFKLSVPVTDDLSAYGKLGLSHSERSGAYTGIGARYQLNEKAAVGVESRKFGNTAEKWGKDSNGSGVNAKLNLGF